MLLSELLSGLEYRLYGIAPDTDITRPFSDSRNAVGGGLFICIRGEKKDGHDFASLAIEEGAVAAVTKERIEGMPCVVVADTRYASAVIWNNFYGRPAEGMRLAGVTGTCGKTTVAALLSACLKEDGRRVGVMGTLGCFAEGQRIDCSGCEKADTCAAMTTPDPEFLYKTLAEFKRRGVTDVVMEVSSHAILQRKIDPLRFFVTVFTNLSPEHLDAHKTMEEYFRVKASFVARGERRVVNCDNSYCLRFAKAVPSVCITARMAENIAESGGKTSYDLSLPGGKLHIESRLLGDFTVENTMLASGAALCLGVEEKVVERAVSKVDGICGRMERACDRERWGFDVIIDYAHTPDSLERALKSLRVSTKGRLICMFGCGGDRDRAKRPLMGAVAERYADKVVVTSDNSRSESTLLIIRDILSGIKSDKCIVIPVRRDAIFAAVCTAEEGDTVLLAGKGHERYEIMGNIRSFFDEKEIINEALRARTANG